MCVRVVHPSLKGTILCGEHPSGKCSSHIVMMSLLCLIIYRTSMCLLHQAQTPQSGSDVPAASFLPAPGACITLTSLFANCPLCHTQCYLWTFVLILWNVTVSLSCFLLHPLRTNSYNSSKKTSASAQGFLPPLKSSVKKGSKGWLLSLYLWHQYRGDARHIKEYQHSSWPL